MADNPTSRGVRNDIRANDINRTTTAHTGFIATANTLESFIDWSGTRTLSAAGSQLNIIYDSKIVAMSVKFEDFDGLPFPVGPSYVIEVGYIPHGESPSGSNFVSLGIATSFTQDDVGTFPIREISGFNTRIPDNTSLTVRAKRSGIQLLVLFNVVLWVESALPI